MPSTISAGCRAAISASWGNSDVPCRVGNHARGHAFKRVPPTAMKFSYSWIRSLVDGLDMPAEALERLITMKTAECESVETVGQLLAEAAAATVESVESIASVNPGGHN